MIYTYYNGKNGIAIDSIDGTYACLEQICRRNMIPYRDALHAIMECGEFAYNGNLLTRSDFVDEPRGSLLELEE